MKSLYVFVLVVFSVALPSQAEIVTVPFEGLVTFVEGTPFGVPLEPNVTPVTGSFKYDTATPPLAVGSGFADFATNIPDGLVMNIPGVSISSSSYFVVTHNNNAFDFDYLGFQASAHGHGSDFRINGVPAQQGGVFVYLADADNTLFLNDNSIRMLPPQSQIDQLDFIQEGRLSDGAGTLGIGRVPEPGAILLAAQLLSVLGLRQRKLCICRRRRSTNMS